MVLAGGRGIRPPLKWVGGKRWLVPHLRPIWEKHTNKRLVEPFCGGLAVTLGLLPTLAVLNDINPHAINFYKQLKKGLRVTIPMSNDENHFYSLREEFNQLIVDGNATTAKAAQLFYYLNRTGYNGLCRFNRQGEFNVPFGRYARINYIQDFTSYQSVLATWDFSVGDFQSVGIERDDFIYADPPYDVEFTQYAKEGFTWENQVRLAEWLSEHDGPVVLSNQATDRVLKLYKKLGFRIKLLDAPRMISCTGDRTRAQEVLATKRV
jgi:DNA adenine methylase